MRGSINQYFTRLFLIFSRRTALVGVQQIYEYDFHAAAGSAAKEVPLVVFHVIG